MFYVANYIITFTSGLCFLMWVWITVWSYLLQSRPLFSVSYKTDLVATNSLRFAYLGKPSFHLSERWLCWAQDSFVSQCFRAALWVCCLAPFWPSLVLWESAPTLTAASLVRDQMFSFCSFQDFLFVCCGEEDVWSSLQPPFLAQRF